MRFLFALLLIFALPLLLSGESSSEIGEPYKAEEFSPWMLKLRRGETIFFGSVPLTFFFTTLAYDSFRMMNNNWDNSYAPIVGSQEYTIEEKKGIVLSTAICSLMVAVADYIIGEIKGRDLSKR